MVRTFTCPKQNTCALSHVADAFYRADSLKKRLMTKQNAKLIFRTVRLLLSPLFLLSTLGLIDRHKNDGLGPFSVEFAYSSWVL